jgi:proliferating cell nuclear antigen
MAVIKIISCKIILFWITCNFLQLNLEIKNVMEWKAIINAISDLADEAMFLCNEDGITFRGMDKAHIAYLSVTFPKLSFEVYEYKTSFFVLPIKEFKNLFDTADNNAIVKLQIEQEDHITILIKGDFEIVYEQKLIAKELGIISIPKVEAKSKLVLASNTLIKIIEDLEKVSRDVTLSTSKNNIQFSGKGESGTGIVDLQQGVSGLEQLEILENSSATYSLEYIMGILQSIGKISEKLTIEFGTGRPIHVSFELTNKISAEYFLSPRT